MNYITTKHILSSTRRTNVELRSYTNKSSNQ